MNQPLKQKNLIFDVGMHKGEDTEYYLEKGFNVVAFEADPDLVELCKKKFSDKIYNNELVIIYGAIVDKNDLAKDTIQFYRNRDISVWGTVSDIWAKRNVHLGTSNELIEVPTVNFLDILNEYGIPYYLKIDIEGMDIVCLKSLLEFDEKPDYISIESEKVTFKNLKKEIFLFKKLGYNNFKVINQSNITTLREPIDSVEGKYLNYRFKYGSSGPFGRDLPKRWTNSKVIIVHYWFIFIGYKLFGDYSKVKNHLLVKLLYKIIAKVTNQPLPGWYDTHAKHTSAK